jgi:hypothetical protein
MTNQGVRQGRRMSPALVNIYNVEAATYDWQIQLKSDFRIGSEVLNKILFAGDQVMISECEYDLRNSYTIGYKSRQMALVWKFQR